MTNQFSEQAEDRSEIDTNGGTPAVRNRKRKCQDHDDKKKITMDDIQILPFKINILKQKLPFNEITEE